MTNFDFFFFWFYFLYKLARLKRRTLTANDINKIKDVTPSLKKGSPNLFRNLRDKGMEISESILHHKFCI